VARTIALANQKGGVAKTTSTLALGAAFAAMGSRALLIDLDPQGCLTYSLGLDSDSLDTTIHDVLVGRVPIGKTIHQLAEVDLVPANIDLAGAEAYLLTRTGREYALRTALEDVQIHYDWVLLDCPPSLGVMTINALTAADAVIIPMQCEALSRAPADEPRARGDRDPSHDVRLEDPALAGGPRRCGEALPAPRPYPGHPEIGPFRGGSTRRALDLEVRAFPRRCRGLPSDREELA
jgi:hypothetical protein